MLIMTFNLHWMANNFVKLIEKIFLHEVVLVLTIVIVFKYEDTLKLKPYINISTFMELLTTIYVRTL